MGRYYIQKLLDLSSRQLPVGGLVCGVELARGVEGFLSSIPSSTAQLQNARKGATRFDKVFGVLPSADRSRRTFSTDCKTESKSARVSKPSSRFEKRRLLLTFRE